MVTEILLVRADIARVMTDTVLEETIDIVQPELETCLQTRADMWVDSMDKLVDIPILWVFA
jgi:hypothetical protein